MKPNTFQAAATIRKLAVEDVRFQDLMAMSINPLDPKTGVLRRIVTREGSVDTPGYIDRSALHLVHREETGAFSVGEALNIQDSHIIESLVDSTDWDHIGLEDPDLFVDETTGELHLFFTIPFFPREGVPGGHKIFLGHATGPDINHLSMVKPVLGPTLEHAGAKEISIAPVNSAGYRLNLVESDHALDGITYSVIRVARCRHVNDDWEYGDIALHPANLGLDWCAGHLSPGPFISKEIIDPGPGKIIGLVNGREANNNEADGTTRYGKFRPGLIIYDYEKGLVDWISPNPLFDDPEAKTITFASAYEYEDDSLVVYSHVDDSQICSYHMDASDIQELIPGFL